MKEEDLKSFEEIDFSKKLIKLSLLEKPIKLNKNIKGSSRMNSSVQNIIPLKN